MQVQAPRTVLAEAAMDTLFLSYADPELAAEVILGHFESARIRTFLVCVKMAALTWWPMTGKSAEPHQNGDTLYGAANNYG